ncbi:hypothetical protein [Mesorhizobium sp. M2C.T.Ca.TU.002.02.1.1]|uniref:hypothetical protein n=1 Tax=Mesorhizobium sp. M2C.T.Ca.TU.002.02.1.1 TaxID=2496788 RepID=UPI000FCBEC37|nr:hypothetical protein [Mesorhizobium sp. M2C.T.Ca.TU.002.02.1.1]RUU59886.1 hypothetical protein EOD07_05700 [Mesorhizobium sp. M2C.T.Ca.TU.002.02.1.1]RUU64666.1 hypothetical protein EOD04_20565 [Mesorhizobium sp. M2C.T.Ca.TU.009.01.2.1]
MKPERHWVTSGADGPLVKAAAGSTFVIMDSFENKTFVTTRRGEILRLDITDPTYQAILAIHEMLIEGLQPLQPIFRP